MSGNDEFDINSRISVNYDSICADINGFLEDMNLLRAEKMFVKTLGNEFSQKIKEYCLSVKNRLYGTFNIVIVGDFKRGKSTLINALIGEDIAPTAVTPETVTINKFSFSETPKTEAVLKNGKKVSLSHNELKKSAIEKITAQLPAEIEYIDILSDAPILKDISVIDTPGVGDLLKRFDDKVAEYLVNADAVIYVISARTPLSLSEQMFLSASVMPQSFSRIFTTVNFSDTLETEEDIKKIEALTKKKISAINPDISVFMLSALDELCRKKNLNRPKPELQGLLENNFLEFETGLNNDIILQKDVIKSTRSVALAKNFVNEAVNRVNLIRASVKANSERLLSSEADLKDKNSELLKKLDGRKTALALEIDEMKIEARGWIRDFMQRLKNEIEAIQTSASVSDLERHFQFYLSDSIKSALIACVERHQKDIEEKISDMNKSLSEEITQSAFGSIDTAIAGNITDISWTGVDSALVYNDLFQGFVKRIVIARPLSLLGQAIAGFIRQGAINKKQSDFLGPVLNGFSAVEGDVINNIDEIYEKIKLNAMDKLDELFQSQIDASMETISQVRKISEAEDIKAEEVEDYLNSVLEKIGESKAVLDKYC